MSQYDYDLNESIDREAEEYAYQFLKNKKSNKMETKQNTGALFANKRKEKETQPDYTGKVNVNGKDMDLSAWVKQDKNGNNYLSLSFKEPYVKAAPSEQPNVKHDDSLPF